MATIKRISLKEGNMLIIAFGILIVLFFLGVAFVFLAQQAGQYATSHKERIATEFAATSGIQYAVAKLADEFLKNGQFTRYSTLFFAGEDQEWNFEYKEENDINKNGLVDTFNLPVEIAPKPSVEKVLISEGNKTLHFKVKIVDESAKLPINDEVKLTSKILQNLSECLNIQLPINKFLEMRQQNKEKEIDMATFLSIFGEKMGNYLAQFFSFNSKPISKTLYYTELVRYDGEKIYSISQLIPAKSQIKIGLKPFININTASYPVLCANFINLSAFYFQIEKTSPNLLSSRTIESIDNIKPLGKIRHTLTDKNYFDKFYKKLNQFYKNTPLKKYNDLAELVFSNIDKEDKIKAEILWANANPNIDTIKFNDIWTHFFIPKSNRYFFREIDKFDLVLPTYPLSFNSSGIFYLEVESRYQYRNIILAKQKISSYVDLLDIIIDTTQQDFAGGIFEQSSTPTKNGKTLITYPEYDESNIKNNDIDGQLSLSFYTNTLETCYIENNTPPLIKRDVIPNNSSKFFSYFKQATAENKSVFEPNNSFLISPTGIIIDQQHSIYNSSNFCATVVDKNLRSLVSETDLYNEISKLLNSAENYQTIYTGITMWLKPSRYSLYNFPLLTINNFFNSISSDNITSNLYSLFANLKQAQVNILYKEFNSLFIPTKINKFYGCNFKESDVELLTNKWVHFALEIKTDSCKKYFAEKSIEEAEKIEWILRYCPYFKVYINGEEIDYSLKKDPTFLKELEFLKGSNTPSKPYLFLGLGNLEASNTFYTIDDISFVEESKFIENISLQLARGRYYNQDTKFVSRNFENKPEHFYLLSSEVVSLPVDKDYSNIICIRFKDGTGYSDCYGNILEHPFTRWNISLFGEYFNYELIWKNTSLCGNKTSPVIDSVILTILKKPTIKIISEN